MWTKVAGRMLATTKALGALALGGMILWNVAQRSGFQKCLAYVHVSTTDVEVTIDDDAYHIDSLAQTPIVCELRPGQHMLQMARDGRVVFEQAFHLERGEEIVLAAWEPPIEPPAVSSAARVLINESLAFRLRPVPKSLQEAECTLRGCNHPR